VRNEYGDLFPHSLSDLGSLEEYISWGIENHRRVGVAFIPSNPKSEIDDFCDLLFDGFLNLTIAFEETPAYSGPSWMPEGFERLVLQGRHNHFDLYFTGQRYSEMNRSLTSQCDYHVIGSTHEPTDLQALEARVGAEATRRIAELEPRTFVTYSVEDHSIRGGVVIP
jgi:hypothetical protein